MKPAWDRLGADYKDSASVMIVDVDCTAEGSGTCGKVGVKGYPTIKYYPAGDKKGKDYLLNSSYCHPEILQELLQLLGNSQ